MCEGCYGVMASEGIQRSRLEDIKRRERQADKNSCLECFDNPKVECKRCGK